MVIIIPDTPHNHDQFWTIFSKKQIVFISTTPKTKYGNSRITCLKRYFIFGITECSSAFREQFIIKNIVSSQSLERLLNVDFLNGIICHIELRQYKYQLFDFVPKNEPLRIWYFNRNWCYRILTFWFTLQIQTSLKLQY